MMASKFSNWGNNLYTGKKSYNVVGNRKNLFMIAVISLAIAVLILGFKGLNFGIEFRGGSQFTVTNVDTVNTVVSDEQPRVSTVGSSAIRIQTNVLDEEQVIAVRGALMDTYSVTEDDVASASVGPSWGKDVSSKALTGLFVF